MQSKRKNCGPFLCLGNTIQRSESARSRTPGDTLTLTAPFYDLAASVERLELAQAFLAAQLLKRQRAFRQVRESEEGDGTIRTTLYLDRATNRLIEACDLNFSYTELDEARIALLDRLHALESPEPVMDSALEPVPDSERQACTATTETTETTKGEVLHE